MKNAFFRYIGLFLIKVSNNSRFSAVRRLDLHRLGYKILCLDASRGIDEDW